MSFSTVAVLPCWPAAGEASRAPAVANVALLGGGPIAEVVRGVVKARPDMELVGNIEAAVVAVVVDLNPRVPVRPGLRMVHFAGERTP